LALLLPVGAAARALYAVDGSSGGPSSLYRIDPRSGRVMREVGPTGFDNITGIAFHPITGVLYAATHVSGSTGELLTIDLETGVGTPVGTHGEEIVDLAFAPSGVLYGWVEVDDDMAQIDLTNGLATFVGDCGVTTSLTGLAVDLDGRAFVKEGTTDSIRSVDRTTGACSGPVALSGPPLDDTLAYDDEGTLYSILRVGSTTQLHAIDPITGDASLVSVIGVPEITDVAFQPPPLEPLYAVDGDGGNAATLYRLDPRDGSVLQTIGALGLQHVVGLAFRPVTEVLYATSNDGGAGGSDQLLTVDVETGAGSAVGAHTGQITDIAFAPAGFLYGFDVAASADDLATIDLASGAQTAVGDCGFATTEPGLTIDARGDAWLKDEDDVYRVDRVTGACTLEKRLDPPGATTENVLATNGRGTHYTVVRTGGTAELYSIDPITGDMIFIGSNNVSSLAALAFQPHPLPPLYATDGAGGTASTLYRLDPRDGSVLETVGAVGFDEVIGLAFHPLTGELYGLSGPKGTGELILIDKETGQGTAIGSHGLAPSNFDGVPDAGFSPSGLLYAWDEGPDDLAVLDLGTGAGSGVGECGASTGSTGFAVDRFGQAWIQENGRLRHVDRVTGSCSATVSVTAAFLRNSITFASQGTVFTIDRPDDIVGTLLTVDTETGDVATVGDNTVPKLAAIAFAPVSHSDLYATDGAGGNAATLYLLDEDDASVVANLGPIGFGHVTGLGFHPVTHALYGISTSAGGGGAELVSIDAETGAGTLVAVHGLDAPDLAFAPSGLLYAWGEDGDGDDLHRVDLATASATAVGDCGFVTDPPGLAVDADGTAWVKDSGSLYRVDRVTGACTLVTAVAGSTDDALAFDRLGALYTLDRTVGGAELFTLDTGSGTLTSLGSNDLGSLSALAFRPLQHHAMFATDGAQQTASTLYRLDPRDGSVVQTIGAIGFEHVTGLAFQPGSSMLYGATSNGSEQLLSIDPSTGAGISLGQHGLTTPDLAFSPGGVLYAWAEGVDDLHTLDLGTAAAASVGECGANTSSTGLAVDFTFRGWMKSDDDLYEVDLGTGACTLETVLSTDADNFLAISDSGTFFTASRLPTTLLTLDRQTGDVLAVGGNSIPTLSAITFLPEPSLGLSLVAGLVVLAGLGRLRRRGGRA
jgi:DNA-binding beta-propeller fold protein YncE